MGKLDKTISEALIGTNESNKKEVNVWIPKRNSDDYKAQITHLWLSSDGEAYAYVWYFGYGEESKINDLPNNWKQEIIDYFKIIKAL